MSPFDVCTTCRHKRHHHQGGAGICTAVVTSLIRGTPEPALESVPCQCNLFRAPIAPVVRFPASDDTPKMVGKFIHGCCGEEDCEGENQAEHICPLKLVPKDFIMAVGKVMRAGLTCGRKPGDWMKYTPDEARNRVWSLLRHTGAGDYDAAACNTLILWWHFQREQDADTLGPGNGAPTT